MSEHLPKSHEHDAEPAKAHEKEQKIENREQHEKTTESKTANKPIESIRHTVEIEADSSEEMQQRQQHDKDSHQSALPAPNKHVKDHARDQLLRNARRQLPKTQQKFSKFIHKPAVERISDAATETVARPSGLLFGGIFSLLSSLGLLIICYRFGYNYNFLVAIVFFGGGFIAGILLEAIARSIRR